MNVADDAVGDDQQYEVVLPVLKLARNLRRIVNDQREVGRPVEGDRGQAVPVVGDYFADARAVRMGGIPVEAELVGDVAVGRELCAKTEGGEHARRVVLLDDLTHGSQGNLVGIRLSAEGVQEVQGVRVPRRPI